MRLIDADKLLLQVGALQTYRLFDDEYTENLITVNDARNVINHMPTVDTVKYGHWIMKQYPIMPEVDVCDQCGLSIPYCHGFNFCPSCGAKMDAQSN